MGLFSFVGKAIKGVAKIGLGAVKVASSLGAPIPLGGLAGKVATQLLASKRPMSNPKVYAPSHQVLRAKTPVHTFRPAPGRPLIASTPRLAQASPVMPGGAVATPIGIAPASSAIPPLHYGKRGASSPKRKRKSTARKRSTSSRKRRSRKLKFGSPAWRKKYLGHGRKKRRRAA